MTMLFWIIFLSVAILGLTYRLVFSGRMYKRKTDRLIAENQALMDINSALEKSIAKHKTKTTNLAIAIENEQRRIASDLHDDTVQRMVAVRFRLEQFLYYPILERAKGEVKEIRKEIDNSIETLRFLIKGLIQPRFELQPLSYLMAQLSEKIRSIHHVRIIEKSINPEQEFDIQPTVKQHLYYII